MKNKEKETPLTFLEAFSILHPLADIIEREMTQGCIVRDFYKYDIKTVSEIPREHFPALFCIRNYGCAALLPIAHGKNLMTSESARYMYAQDPVNYYLKNYPENREARWFVLDPDDKGKLGITEIKFDEARRTYRRLLLPYLITVKPQLPKRCKVRLRFHNITLSRLKELLSDSRKIKKEWPDDPDTVGGSLLQALKWKQKALQLGPDHHYDIWWHERDHEFSFSESGVEGTCLSGAIIFHGTPDEGYMTNGSVQINPCYGWSSHT